MDEDMLEASVKQVRCAICKKMGTFTIESWCYHPNGGKGIYEVWIRCDGCGSVTSTTIKE